MADQYGNRIQSLEQFGDQLNQNLAKHFNQNQKGVKTTQIEQQQHPEQQLQQPVSQQSDLYNQQLNYNFSKIINSSSKSSSHDKLEQAKGVDFCILTFSGPGFLVLS